MGRPLRGYCVRDDVDDYPPIALLELPLARSLVRVHTAYGALLVLLVVAVVCFRLARGGFGRQRWLASCRRAVRRWRTPSVEDVKVREHANAKHLEFWRRMFSALLGISTVGTAGFLLLWHQRGALSSLLWEGDLNTETILNAVFITGYGAMVYLLTFSILFTVFPSLLSVRSLYAWISLTTLRVYLGAAVPMPLPMFERYMAVMFPLRMLIITHCWNVPFVICFNLLCGVVNVYLTEEQLAKNAMTCFNSVVTQEVLNFCCIHLVFFIHRHMMLWQIRATLEAKSSRNVEASVEFMLNGVCDAVVHLNEDFTMRQPSQKLDALLLRVSGLKDSQSFLELLHGEADKERFCEFMHPKVQDGILPGTLHLDMADSCQAPVHVQLFHTSCLDAMDERFHIVGVRESGDVGVASWRQAQLRQEAAEEAPSAMLSLPAQRRRSQDSISELSSVSSEVGALALASVEEHEPNEVAVWIDTARRGLPMKKCTPEFFTMFGTPSLKMDTKLLSWVKVKERKMVQEEVQYNVNCLVVDDIESSLLQVCLLLPHMNTCEVLADIGLSLADPPEPDESLTSAELARTLMVKLTFSDIRFKRRSMSELPRLQAGARDSDLQEGCERSRTIGL